jgi:hypothetical protein
MKDLWKVEVINGTLKWVQYITYSTGKVVKRVYNNLADKTDFEVSE